MYVNVLVDRKGGGEGSQSAMWKERVKEISNGISSGIDIKVR